MPAINQRSSYVALTRGKEKVEIYTDDRKELLGAMSRPDEPINATELSNGTQPDANGRKRRLRGLMAAHGFGAGHSLAQSGMTQSQADRGLDHDR